MNLKKPLSGQELLVFMQNVKRIRAAKLVFTERTFRNGRWSAGRDTIELNNAMVDQSSDDSIYVICPPYTGRFSYMHSIFLHSYELDQ